MCYCDWCILCQPEFSRHLWHSDTRGWASRVPRCRKITNDGVTRSGTVCFIAVRVYPYGNSGRQRVNSRDRWNADQYITVLQSFGIMLRQQPTRRTSWKLVANPGWQPRFSTSFQLKMPLNPNHPSILWVANKFATWQIYHDMQVGNVLRKWNVENDQACDKLPTSFQLVRLVGCGLYVQCDLC